MPRYTPDQIINAYRLMIAKLEAGKKINFSAIAKKVKASACTVNRWYHEAKQGKAKNRYGKMWKKAEADRKRYPSRTPPPKKARKKKLITAVGPKIRSKAGRVKDWLTVNPEGSYTDCCKALGTKLTPSTFYGARLKLQGRKQAPQGGPDRVAPKPDKGLALEAENKYLRWVNEGYRLGYVDRLMADYL